MSEELKPCPCGETPTKLHVCDAAQGGKWAIASPDCCGEWETEFRTDYYALDSDECKKLAYEAWNRLPRSTERQQALDEAIEAVGKLQTFGMSISSRFEQEGVKSAIKAIERLRDE